MTSSNTYTFDPANADLVIEAFSRIGKRANQLNAEMLLEAAASANFRLVRWSNRGVNLWKMEKFTQLLVAGQATYALDARVVNTFEVWISQGTPAEDRMLSPMGRSDYAAVPDKTEQGGSTSYWFQRLRSPQITLWLVPDANGPYTLSMNCMVRIQDMAASLGQTADMPFRFLDAFCAELAIDLARKYDRTLVGDLKLDAAESWKEATSEDREVAPVRIVPDLSSYYR